MARQLDTDLNDNDVRALISGIAAALITIRYPDSGGLSQDTLNAIRVEAITALRQSITRIAHNDTTMTIRVAGSPQP